MTNISSPVVVGREIYVDLSVVMIMGESSGATKTVQSSQPGVMRRLLELLMMLVSALLVMFAWDTAGKAQEESAKLRQELRRVQAEQVERAGTWCTVCLDSPREVLLQPCGHVVRGAVKKISIPPIPMAL